MTAGLIGADFFTNRPTAFCDPGSRWSLSGHVGLSTSNTYTVVDCFRVSTSTVYRRVGVDERERAGRDMWSEHGSTQSYRSTWEQSERLSPHAIPAKPNVADWMCDADYNNARDSRKARGQAQGLRPKRSLKFAFLDMLNTSFRALGADSGKRPVLVVGKEGKGNRSVRGARGFFSRELIQFLSEFFLVLLLDEHNTSKLTPCCHTESVFATDHELRSKRCQHCTVTYAVKKPVANDAEPTRTISFCYDRDLGASVNFAHIAIFMAATGKRPSAFSRSVAHTGP